ncbi:MAG: adenylate/guanylate cyclase domain-containing protein [Anaerolineae bacterium]|nr:adenylate/guanylate cyclase domain-containing protein [Anaerolineae bacterium]MCI0607701.1 adenylate/guanylate cyclase domain-containing protein [Anaerolineae bacterium]
MEDFYYKIMNWAIDKKFYNETWYYYLTGEWRDSMPVEFRFWQKYSEFVFRSYSRLPSDPHCFECGVPMAGFGGNLLRIIGSAPSSFSPRLCNGCEKSARKYEIGAEVELSMIFADVRDSTPLAESLGPSGFKDIIGKFYKETSKVLIERNAMVNRLMGDQVIALFVPRFVGKNHAEVALEAAKDLLRVTGHGQGKEPWIPVGAGVHTGTAYVGAVGAAEGVTEIAVLGIAPTLCSRLSSKAAAGEILISEASVKSGNLDMNGLETRSLELKGVSEPVSVRVMKV